MTIDFMYKVGDRVTITPTDGQGFVDAVLASCYGKEYRVVYWLDGQRISQWVYEKELEAVSPENA